MNAQRMIELVLIFTSILFIVDPFAVIPTFLAMTVRDSPQQRRVLARRGAWTCAITLIAFALGGSMIFKIFGITIGAFKIAGGVLIGLNALDMVQARRSQQRETAVEKAEGIEKEDIGILPLGVPMLAGPGAISTVMVLALGAKSPAATAAVYVSILLTALISYLVLAAASLVERRLGQTGMRILTRLMGLVLCAIAVQFIIDGVKLSFAISLQWASPSERML
jgi:multiple antibiotic resistance protein